MLYVAACLVVPFLWGVLIHWVFRKFEPKADASEEARAESPARASGRERVAGLWDYHI
jgi:hypothetical protein